MRKEVRKSLSALFGSVEADILMFLMENPGCPADFVGSCIGFKNTLEPMNSLCDRGIVYETHDGKLFISSDKAGELLDGAAAFISIVAGPIKMRAKPADKVEDLVPEPVVEHVPTLEMDAWNVEEAVIETFDATVETKKTSKLLELFGEVP